VDHRKRASQLLEKMSIEEKAAQLYSVWLRISPDGTFTFRESAGDFFSEGALAPEQALQHGIGQITRPLGTRPADARGIVAGLNSVQKFLVENTRLGIPALPHEEALPGVMVKGATQFPSALNYASTWDPDLMERVGRAIGDELHSIGSRQALSPVLDVARDARWGRTDETLGEDPYLVGMMATAYVRGLQGDERRLLATLKHYVGHSFSEGGRNHAPVRIGPNEMNDVFLLPFEMAVKLANAGSVMPAYHDVDGEPSSASRYFITDILREKWGFDGIVVSDYGAVELLMAHHRVARDTTEATALAIAAGMDIELPGFSCFRTGIPEAIDRGLLDVDAVNAAVKRVLIEKSRLGLFEHPYTDVEKVVLNSPTARDLARKTAIRSITLLENNGVLPLADSGTVAVIGPCADDQLALFCGYSFPVHLISSEGDEANGEAYAETLINAIRKRARVARVLHARGCDILSERPSEPPVFPLETTTGVEQRTTVSSRRDGFEEAVTVAREADVVVLALGDLSGRFLSGTVGEGSDASLLRLPGVQEELYQAVVETGTPVVLVLLNGRPYELGEIRRTAAGIVEAWLPGQEGAAAISAVLFGDENPGGRLPVSFPKAAGAMPYFYNHKLKSPGTPIQPDFGPVYPFGYGLSYASFEYLDFQVAEAEVDTNGTIEVGVTVANTSDVEGEEVVQLYVRDLYASLVRPVMELKGFHRIDLRAGDRKRVTFELPVDMLSFTVHGLERIVEPGDVRLMVGSSSGHVHFESVVTLTGTKRTLGESWQMICRATAAEA